MRAFRAGFPLTTTFPELGWIRSPMIRNNVDLPQPDGPIRETNSRSSIVRSISCNAVVSPNRFVILSIVTTLISGHVLRRTPDDDLLRDHDHDEERDPEPRCDD